MHKKRNSKVVLTSHSVLSLQIIFRAQYLTQMQEKYFDDQKDNFTLLDAHQWLHHSSSHNTPHPYS